VGGLRQRTGLGAAVRGQFGEPGDDGRLLAMPERVGEIIGCCLSPQLTISCLQHTDDAKPRGPPRHCSPAAPALFSPRLDAPRTDAEGGTTQ
jgi:hypothetical protein